MFQTLLMPHTLYMAVLLAGPICGYIGARNLKQCCMLVYLVFCTLGCMVQAFSLVASFSEGSSASFEFVSVLFLIVKVCVTQLCV